MKCNTSQTASSASVKPAPQEPEDQEAAEQKEAEAVFTSLMMGNLMKPLAAKMGGLGQMLVEQMASQVAGVDSAEARLQ